MKKLVLVLLAAVLIVSCQKKEVETTTALQDVSFRAIEVIPDLKSTTDWECKDDIPTHAWVEINDVDYYPELFELDGQLYTQAIKLAEGADYCVENFILYKEGNGIDGYQADPVGDIVVFGTPMDNSHYAPYVTRPLEYCFDVSAFVKTQIDLQVLCYLDADYDKFGFNWFGIQEIVIRQFCFFGDICLNGAPYTPADFNNSLYGTNLGVDIPAIMRVDVFVNGQPAGVPSFNNEEFEDGSPWLGIGDALCVDYPDNLSTEDEFSFDLYVYTMDCDGVFGYKYFATYTSTDDGPLDIEVGTDNVLDFVVGSCNYTDTDVTFGHHEWLVNSDLFDADNPNGFLFTDDPTQSLWKWTRNNTQGYNNIANPIAVSLYYAGYEEAGLLGFESIYNFIEGQYNTSGTAFSSAAMYGLLSGYHATSNSDYFDLAADFFAQFMAKYPSDGSGDRPRDDYWGYDFLQLLTSANMSDQAGLTGAVTYNLEWKAIYLAEYEAKAAASDYHKIFINVIATQLGVGDHQGMVDWPTIVSDNDALGYLSNQEGAYVLIGGSYGDSDAVKSYLIEHVCVADYSEPVAEVVYALGL